MLTNRNEQIVAVFAGCPVNNMTWAASANHIHLATQKLGEELKFNSIDCLPRPSNGYNEMLSGQQLWCSVLGRETSIKVQRPAQPWSHCLHLCIQQVRALNEYDSNAQLTARTQVH